ncbi:vesicular glutamate transporter 1-like [Aethina tumida]|uniref:vesicular glutamate transporter 1-like n=1 Tax=Aethina tumida TaxID=116153 RepID=UPI00214966B2|nr:vesicular glutamate transporter 1-like [Aethina tumida]
MTIQRKGFVVFSHLLPSLCMFAMMFIGCNAYVDTVLLCMTLFFNAAVVCTTIYNPQDLAPNFAGTIFGIISTIGGISQFLVPVTTAAITEGGNTMDEWRWVFVLAGSIFLVGGLAFIFMGSSEKQPWNEPKETTL